MGFESSFQSDAIAYLNSIPHCRAENVSGNSHQSGRPDINGCLKGRMFKVELKVPDNKNVASKKQSLELRRWKNAGAVIGVIYSLKALRQLFSEDWSSDKSVEIKEENGCISWYQIPK